MNTFIFIIIMVTFFAIYGFLNFFIAKRLFTLLSIPLKKINKKIFSAVFAVVAVMPFLSFIPLGSFLSGIFGWIGFHWFGLFVYLLLYFLSAELVIFIIHFFIKGNKFQKVKIVAGITAVVLAFGTTGYGLYNAATPETTSYNVKLDSSLQNELNLVLITDIHLGALGSENRIPKMVKQVNALNPDIVCIAGDIFDGDTSKIDEPEKIADLFKQIKSKYGVYACLGNHDAGSTLNNMFEFLEDCNIKLLRDSHEVIDNRFVLVGRLDSSPIGSNTEIKRNDTSKVMNDVKKYGLPVIVMDHNPSNIDQYNNSADLILCGHTHKGQLFPASIVTYLMYDVHYGYYRKNANSPQVIVSSGLGTWGMPMKVGSESEIVNIKIS